MSERYQHAKSPDPITVGNVVFEQSQAHQAEIELLQSQCEMLRRDLEHARRENDFLWITIIRVMLKTKATDANSKPCSTKTAKE